MFKNSLHKDLKERGNIAYYTYRLDSAGLMTFTGATSDRLKTKEIAALQRTLEACFSNIQESLEQRGFQLDHLVLTLDARGQRPE